MSSERLRTSSHSSDSSRAGSPDTRATTPSSLLSNQDSSCHPARYVYTCAGTLTPIALETLFTKHASEERLGLIFGQTSFSSASLSTEAEWEHSTLDETEYFVSSTYQRSESSRTMPYVSTDPKHAAHLHLFALAGLRSVLALPSSSPAYTAYILERPPFMYKPLSYTNAHSLLPGSKAEGNIPTLADWDTLWANWDAVTLGMIPESMLHQKPIDLRHKCLFYIGHIPTFLDMLLSKAIGGGPTEPAWFWKIFERGIDPHVDDPDHCHNHSEVPTNDADWPSLADILRFRDGVRARLRSLYADLASGRRALSRNIARTLVMTHEHEGFHVETLLYMLIQKAACAPGTLPPPGASVPQWSALAAQWSAAPRPKVSTVLIDSTEVTLGQNDSEVDDFLLVDGKNNTVIRGADVAAVPGHTYGWDNESPARTVKVGAFRASWRCVTNSEFFAFWRDQQTQSDVSKKVAFPKSWVMRSNTGDEENVIPQEDDVFVRTLFGLVPLRIAAEWPVLTAYDDLATYAAAQGGRLPNEAELRAFLDLYDVGFEGGGNVGFRNWHPVPSTMGLDTYGSKGTNGGVWEWTSTVFETHEGLVPTRLFTGYSEDFFDTKHQVSLGASYATIPRLGRRTVRNFYQHNYPYPWIGARVVYDV